MDSYFSEHFSNGQKMNEKLNDIKKDKYYGIPPIAEFEFVVQEQREVKEDVSVTNSIIQSNNTIIDWEKISHKVNSQNLINKEH